ncbi:SDR family NAD(P)-dependent oxidoreductase [Psychromonas sp. RZ5]|uniref:type I polyketide synthase n=1 Tax=Psychromonas algicola TaxID=2555642 RepID=UPI001067DD51|nr:type I polyketide synthase [Psychromonas sp. RZ5]TEW53001.1 SDR family NAD(P)-dependent oxidoreductase [Psychromonas sp. RZ5]
MSNKPSNESTSEQVSDKQINSRLQETPIAIVGMASVFAESKNLSQFWDTIVNSVNGIQDVPEDRWAIDDYYSADKKAADKSYCKRGGFLPEIDFDPMEFGLPPNLLELTDITQLMALVVARDVLADAGVNDESSFDRDKMGITLGVGGGQKQGGQLMSRLQGPVLEKVLKASGLDDNDTNVIVDKFKKAYIPWEENSFPGMLGNVIAGRIANRFNFGGTNCVVDAACAGSLAAIKMAVSDLLEYRSDMMLSGGICCDNSPFMYMSFSKTPAFTDGDCIRPFDENSNGMMIGEGVGMIALKRLEDAERDGDRIYSVIKGIGSSSDGKFKSIYAPRPEGQLKALKRAYADAGVDPKTCGLIEAHGTGTKAGDAAEFRGLDLLFSESADLEKNEKQHVALGSVKSQVGHTKAAAGTAGLIKAALALHHKVLPATINVDKPNQNLDIENTSLYINSETRPWMQRADGEKRRAGISSFGFGGTNFHIVLEEYNAEQKGAYRLNEVSQSFLFSADNKAALVSTLHASANALNVESELQPYAFNELVLSFPIQKINKDKVRCGFVAEDAVEAKKLIKQIIQQLSTDDSKAWSKPSGIYYREQGVVTKGKVAALFSGQGSQYLNMGRELTCHFPSMMSSQTAIDKAFHQAGKASLSSVVYPTPVFEQEKRAQQELDLRLTQYAQPAIGSFSVGLFNTFKQAGFKADFAAGHSFGELTALWAADVLSENDYMTLAMARGEAMSAPEDVSFDAGSMAAVIGDVVEIESKIKNIDGVSIANYNANNQAVIAGATDAIKVAAEQLTKDGFKVIELPVSAAFHTPLVSHAQAPFAKAIDAVTFNKPKMAVFANATGEAHSDNQDDIKAALKDHILQSVQFSKEINNLYDAGARVFVEFGPKNVLTRLVDNILEGKDDVVTIATNANAKQSSDLQLRLAAVELAVLGVELDNIDPYSAIQRPTVAPKKSPLAMKLSGASYVSPKTKKAFQDELTDDWKISSIAAPAKEVIKEVIVEKVVEKVVEKIVYVDSTGKPVADQQAAQASTPVVSNIGASVEQFINHQSQLLSVHQAYLEGPNQYADTFKTVLEAQAGQQALPEGLDKTLAMYHDFQTETLRVHETYLNNQTASMQQMLSGGVVAPEVTPLNSKVVDSTVEDNKPAVTSVAPNLQQQLQATHKVIQEHKAPIVHHAKAAEKVQAATVTQVAVNTPVDTKAIENTMLSVVADKTGYPTDMLELSMDMEADLGIDSIKRVEILGAVQDEITDLPELDAEQLSQMRTLAEIVNYMNEVAASSAPVISSNVKSPATVSSSIDTKAIENTMLSVVADKTGYPTDMLELSMDMEADLGIDSIKRVEILGAVQDEITDLPELDAEQLSQMRTLAEIVNYMNEVAGGSNTATIAETVTTSSMPELTTYANASVDLQKIESTMLSVVADKTGYPTDMLELSMDMEADLGIDSIKRVEILGAVQDEITDLPELDAEQLSQMRTLAEIVNYMNEVAGSVAASPMQVASTAQVATASVDIQQIESTMLSVVADKTGYPTDMLELSMDMEADLGIDSIKRVEILGAVQDEITDLPELDAEQLSQMRTLAEIVNYMNEVAGGSNTATIAETVTTSSMPELTTYANASVDLQKIESTMLSVVADKTGYPTDMLELSMDMEADLGIDSIKRVEILGAVQDEITDLPELDAEQLSQMRTLAEIVNYMSEVAGGSNVEVNAEIVASSSTPELTTFANTTVDLQKIESTMLSVVADKTGYPTDMLELSMDMEADLGIDSIKRVEILGAVQDEIINLPELDAEQLSQMRTLAEIVNYMHDVATPSESSVMKTSANEDKADIEVVVLNKEVSFVPSPSSIVEVMQLPEIECIDSTVSNKNCLLVNDGLDSAVQIANHLVKFGWIVTLLTPNWIDSTASKKLDDAIANITLADATEVDIEKALGSSQWHSVIYLNPKTKVEGIRFESNHKKGLQLAFLLAKLTKLNQPVLGQENNDVRSSFVVLTRQGGDFATNKIEKKVDLIQAGLAGLVKTLDHEWENVFCRIIDIPSSYAANKVENIVISELNDKQTSPVEVGFNKEGRLTLVAKSTDSYALESGNHITQNSVFLVSGGAKGVTAHCVVEIAKQHQCRFILLGRSQYQADEANWSLNHATEEALKKAAMQHLIDSGKKPSPKLIKEMIYPVMANREITQTLTNITAAGGVAEYVSADVCNKQNVSDVIQPICDVWGDVTGIIHGAGVLADKYIEQKTLQEFDQVYNTKIMGLDSLLACCDLNKLTHLVMFSSAAGFYGNPGQSDYAIANEILNKAAYRFKSLYPKAQVLSFNWGPWDGGMVTPELKRMFDERGVYIIPVESGAKLLASELAANSNRCVQIVVGTDMSGDAKSEDASIKKPLTGSLVKVFNTENNSLLAHHKIGENQVLPTVCAIAWMKEACEALYPDYYYQGIEDFKLFKGIVFDGQEVDQFLIEMKLTETKPVIDDSLLTVEVTVSSKKEQGKSQFHYRALVNLSLNNVKQEFVYQDELPLPQALTVKACESVNILYQDGSLFHGKNFQGIKQLHHIDQSGLLMECVIDESTLAAQGEFLLADHNVLANDLVYQALLIWTNKLMGVGSLPTKTNGWQVYREVGINEVFFIKLTITETAGQRVVGDLLLVDSDNKIIAKVSGAEVTCSATLAELFKASA